MGFFFGAHRYTPVPRGQYPNDHSSPKISTPPWNIPPTLSASRVNVFREVTAEVMCALSACLMSYTERVTSAMMGIRFDRGGGMTEDGDDSGRDGDARQSATRERCER